MINVITNSPVPQPNPIPAVGQPGPTIMSGNSQAVKGPRKIWGVDVRSLLTVFGLTAFFVVAMVGVIIALRTGAGQKGLTPTAPERPSADVAQVANCSLTFNVPGASPSPSPSP